MLSLPVPACFTLSLYVLVIQGYVDLDCSLCRILNVYFPNVNVFFPNVNVKYQSIKSACVPVCLILLT